MESAFAAMAVEIRSSDADDLGDPFDSFTEWGEDKDADAYCDL